MEGKIARHSGAFNNRVEFERIGQHIWNHTRFSSDLCDRQSVIHLAKNHRYHKRTKHIDVRYHRIRQWVAMEKAIDLIKISTKKNPTDMMTKTILVEKFRVSLNFIKVF